MEQRLIDANALKRYIPTRMDMQDLYLPVHFKTLIDEQPTVDAVPVVRCRECKHYRKIEDHSGICVVLARVEQMTDDFYCADGERRTE